MESTPVRRRPLQTSDGIVAIPQASPPQVGNQTSTPSDDREKAIREALQSRRRPRIPKVCQPCRIRKVKCSYGTPCEPCAERGHPELCSYAAEPTAKRPRLDPSLDTGRFTHQVDDNWKPSRSEWDALNSRLHSIEEILLELRSSNRSQAVPGANSRVDLHILGTDINPSQDAPMPTLLAQSVVDTDEVYLGANSVPALVNALANERQGDSSVRKLLDNCVLPVFALDNETATYPFVDLQAVAQSPSQRMKLLCRLLPVPEEIMQTFKLYRDTAHVLYPAIIDIQEFESQLLEFLRLQSSGTSATSQGPLSVQVVYGKDIHWLGLLFATLASGVQCSDLPRRERQMKSQVFICAAYDCLRLINFYTQTTLVDLQVFLVVNNVISNNMNAGISWSLVGLTIRLAQSIGLHVDLPSLDLNLPQTARSRIWWRIVWQDSLLSITFDRSSPTTIVTHYQYTEPAGTLSYADVMCRLCRKGLDIVQERSLHKPTHERLAYLGDLRSRIELDWKHAAGHLIHVAACQSMKELLEHWNLHLHRSFILSELCRPSLRYRVHSNAQSAKSVLLELRDLCIENLAKTVEAFLSLHNISKFAMRSWAAVHRALSSALLLCILQETSRDPQIQMSVSRLAAIMSEAVMAIDPSDIAAPFARSVAALQKLALPASDTSGDHALRNTFGELGAGEFYNMTGQDSSTSESGTLGSSPELAFWDSGKEPFSLLNDIFWGADAITNPVPEQGT